MIESFDSVVSPLRSALLSANLMCKEYKSLSYSVGVCAVGGSALVGIPLIGRLVWESADLGI